MSQQLKPDAFLPRGTIRLTVSLNSESSWSDWIASQTALDSGKEGISVGAICVENSFAPTELVPIMITANQLDGSADLGLQLVDRISLLLRSELIAREGRWVITACSSGGKDSAFLLRRKIGMVRRMTRPAASRNLSGELCKRRYLPVQPNCWRSPNRSRASQ